MAALAHRCAVGRRPRRLPERACWPDRQAEGAPKRLLYIGIAIVAFFLILAIFAPLIAPYGFDQVESRRRPLPQAGRRPPRSHLFGTTVQSTDVLSRVDLGRAHGDRGRGPGGHLLAR